MAGGNDNLTMFPFRILVHIIPRATYPGFLDENAAEMLYKDIEVRRFTRLVLTKSLSLFIQKHNI
jgi:hypothetical protein